MPKKKKPSTTVADIHRDRQRLPDVLVDKFGQFGFVKWTSAFCPVLIVDPMELIQQKVLPEGIYHAWMYKIDLNLEDETQQIPALIYWYGTTYEFSVVAMTDVIPFEQGKALGYHEVPEFMQRRMDLDESVPAVYQLVSDGMDELKTNALKLAPEQRSAIIVNQKRKRQVVLNEWHALSMDVPPEQQLWMEQRDRLEARLPNSQHFGTVGFLPFTKGGNKQNQKHYHPILILSPFRVPPGPVRKEWFHKCSSKQMVLVYWFGAYICGRPQSAYSFTFLSQVISWEAGKEQGYHKLPAHVMQEYYGSTNTRPSRKEKDAQRSIGHRVSWTADWLVCGHWELQQALSKEPQDRWGGLEDFEESFADDFEYYWECIEAAEAAIQAKRQHQVERDDTPKPESQTSTIEQSAAAGGASNLKQASKSPNPDVSTSNVTKKRKATLNGDEISNEKAMSPKRRPYGIHPTEENGRMKEGGKLKEPSARNNGQSVSKNKLHKNDAVKSMKQPPPIDDHNGRAARQIDRNGRGKEYAVGSSQAILKSDKLRLKKLKKRRRSQEAADGIASPDYLDNRQNGRKDKSQVLESLERKKAKKRRRSRDFDYDDDDEAFNSGKKTAHSRHMEGESSSQTVVASFRIPRKGEKQNKRFGSGLEDSRIGLDGAADGLSIPFRIPKKKDKNKGQTPEIDKARAGQFEDAPTPPRETTLNKPESKPHGITGEDNSKMPPNSPEAESKNPINGNSTEGVREKPRLVSIDQPGHEVDNATLSMNGDAGERDPMGPTNKKKKLKKKKKREKAALANDETNMSGMGAPDKEGNHRHETKAKTSAENGSMTGKVANEGAGLGTGASEVDAKESKKPPQNETVNSGKDKNVGTPEETQVDEVAKSVKLDNKKSTTADEGASIPKKESKLNKTKVTKAASTSQKAASTSQKAAPEANGNDRVKKAVSPKRKNDKIAAKEDHKGRDTSKVSSDRPEHSKSQGTVAAKKLEPPFDLSVPVDDLTRKVVPTAEEAKAEVSLLQHMEEGKFSLVQRANDGKARRGSGKKPKEAETSLDEEVHKSLLHCAAALKSGKKDGTATSPKKGKTKKRKKEKEVASKPVAKPPTDPEELAEIKRRRETQEVVAQVIQEWTRNKERMMQAKLSAVNR